MNEDKFIQVNNLEKTYENGYQAIKSVSFSVKKGDLVCLLGPSGCGKSTILSILSNLIPSSGGEISLKDSSLAYMLQEDCLLPFRTILDNCLIGLEVTGNLNKESKNYVINLLKTYGLGDFMYKYPNNLSGGMRQRCALIRTLATKPDILLLDEAMSALDYQSRLAISDDIYKIIKNEGKTVIMVTHDIAEAISMSDRIIVLTKRPSKVKKIYEVKFENKSTPINNRKAKEFSIYYDKIWRDLDVHI